MQAAVAFVTRRWRVLAGAAAFVIAATGVVTLAAVQTVGEIEASLPALPDPSAVPTSTIVVDRDGKLLRPFTIADGRWRLPVTRADVDKRFVDMLIAYEDRRFSTHSSRSNPTSWNSSCCLSSLRLILWATHAPVKAQESSLAAAAGARRRWWARQDLNLRPTV